MEIKDSLTTIMKEERLPSLFMLLHLTYSLIKTVENALKRLSARVCYNKNSSSMTLHKESLQVNLVCFNYSK